MTLTTKSAENPAILSADQLANSWPVIRTSLREYTPKSAIGKIARSQLTIAKPSLYVIG